MNASPTVKASTVLTVWTLIGCSLLGCNSRRPGLVEVSGRITLDGGAWPRPGVLILAPIASAAPDGRKRPARAPFDESGHFEAGTWQPGDGVLPGTYKVCVECWEVPPTMGGPPAKGYVPEKYRTVTTSDLQIEVPADSSSEEFVLDVPTATSAAAPGGN
jgi:hypothetical protein